MEIRERIKAYTYLGGSWNHLSVELQETGMSKELTKLYICKISINLGHQNSINALNVFDHWLKYKNEKETKLFISIVSW